MEIEVKGEPQALAGHRLLEADYLPLTAPVIDDHLALPVDSGQDFVVLPLHSGLADGLAEVVLGEFRRVQLGVTYFPRVADHMRGQSFARIQPALRVDQFHFRVALGAAVGLDESELASGQLFLNGDRLVAGPGGETLQAGQKLGGIELQAVGNLADVFQAQILPGQNQAERGVVVDDHAPIAVQDLPSRRGHRQRLDAVAIGLLAVELRVAHLQLPESRDQIQKHGHGQVLKHHDPRAGELRIVAPQRRV